MATEKRPGERSASGYGGTTTTTTERDGDGDRVRRMVRAARRNRGGVSRRAAAVLVSSLLAVGLFGGFAFAATLTTTTVTQSAASYGSASSSVANWPTAPALAVAVVPAGTNGCVDTATLGSSAPGTTVVVNPNGTGATCAAGDFGENFSFAPAAALTGETDYFAVSAVWTTVGGTYSGTTVLALTVGANSDGGGYHLDVLIDLGRVAPLSIDSLTVIVS